MTKNLLKRCIIVSVLFIFSMNTINFASFAMNDIVDNMLLKSLNNSIKQYVLGREDTQEILEADAFYVKSLDASNMGITDISGLEQFVYIDSTIDLSNNNISDITPLFQWVDNKEEPNLSANIFLGNNPILFKNNYQQILTLASMSENIHIYDSKRDGDGVVELTGFVNGRPTEQVEFNKQLINENSNNSSPVADSSVNTGTVTFVIYIFGVAVILFVLWSVIRNKKVHN